jgi:hypothetical protein
MAWACTVAEGATFFGDGKISKSVARGTRITAFATMAQPGVSYQLVVGNNTTHPAHACHDLIYVVNPNTRFATSDKFLGNTSGPAGDANTPPGLYQVCFRAINVTTATAAVALTLT